jgi:hypothetical protein
LTWCVQRQHLDAATASRRRLQTRHGHTAHSALDSIPSLSVREAHKHGLPCVRNDGQVTWSVGWRSHGMARRSRAGSILAKRCIANKIGLCANLGGTLGERCSEVVRTADG